MSIAGGGNVALSGGVATGSGSNLSIAGGGTDTVTAPISGGAAIVYAGTGTGSLTFGVDNSYSGSTTINSNSLILNTANGLGNSTGVIVAAGGGGALVLNNTSGTPATFGTTPAAVGVTIPLTLNGPGNANAAGALASISGNNTYPGAITLGSSATIASTSTTVGDALTLTGGISVPTGARLTVVGPGLTTVGTISGGGAVTVNATTGTVTLPAANSYSNGTQLTSGTLAVSNNSALGSGTATLSGGTLRLQGTPSIGIGFPAPTTTPRTICLRRLSLGSCHRAIGTTLRPAARRFMRRAELTPVPRWPLPPAASVPGT